MQSPSSPLATAGQRPYQSISVSSNAPNGTSLANGVNNHDSSTTTALNTTRAPAGISSRAKEKQMQSCLPLKTIQIQLTIMANDRRLGEMTLSYYRSGCNPNLALRTNLKTWKNNPVAKLLP